MIQVENLVVRYGEMLAVDGLGFEVRPGEILALLGPNGAGKSSTVRCLIGLQTPQEGRILLGGFDLSQQPREARTLLAYMPENAKLYEGLTPREILALRGRLFGFSEEKIRDKTAHLLGALGLGEVVDQATASFSKGMKQKVVLALALMTEAKIFILDEPLSGLDAETTLVFRQLLTQLCERGCAILYCSHMLDVVERIAHRVLILAKGKQVAAGSMEECLKKEGGTLESLFRSATHATDPDAVAKELLADYLEPEDRL